MTNAVATDNATSAVRAAREPNEYAVLKKMLRREGLFERQLRYYAIQALYLAAFLIASVALLVAPVPFMAKMGAAVMLAFTFTHLGYVGHDAGHRQIFSRVFPNDIVLLIIGTLMGTSRSWWVVNHNMHHSNPNDLQLDPHTAIPTLAFSDEQAQGKRGFMRLLAGYQAFYFFPLLMLEGVGVRLASVQFLTSGRAKYPLIEGLGMVLHFSFYFVLLLTVFSAWQAVAFIVVHQSLMGLYMGSVFAPNHKGMLIPDGETNLGFLREQVLTTRNVKPHPITDFWYGGLNYQIEHHLFPNMPRNKLKSARPIIKAFCAERSIPYYETGVIRSYVEVASYLHEVSRPMRTARPALG